MLPNQKNSSIVLTYSVFDWDDNILHMDTKIIMEKLVNNVWVETPVSTTDFAIFRKNPLYRVPLKEDGSPDYDKAYSNFRDVTSDNIFLNDVIDAINNKKHAPSYNAFKKCLINGRLFFLVTARGHEPSTIRRAVEYFIDTQLTKEEKNKMRKNLIYYYNLFNETIEDNNTLLNNYLSLCEYIGVTSKYWCEKLKFNTNDNTELLKKIAIGYIINKLKKYKINDYKIKIGFSDDDIHNIKTIENFFKNELKHKNNNIHFYVFDTSKNEDGSKNYRKIKI
jgi:hypothetical protein